MSSATAIASVALAWLIFQSLPESCRSAALLYVYNPEQGLISPYQTQYPSGVSADIANVIPLKIVAATDASPAGGGVLISPTSAGQAAEVINSNGAIPTGSFREGVLTPSSSAGRAMTTVNNNGAVQTGGLGGGGISSTGTPPITPTVLPDSSRSDQRAQSTQRGFLGVISGARRVNGGPAGQMWNAPRRGEGNFWQDNGMQDEWSMNPAQQGFGGQQPGRDFWQDNSGSSARATVQFGPMRPQQQMWNDNGRAFDVDPASVPVSAQQPIAMTIGSTSGSLQAPDSSLSALPSGPDSEPLLTGVGPGGPWDLSYVNDPVMMAAMLDDAPGQQQQQFGGVIQVNGPPGTSITVQQAGTPLQQTAADYVPWPGMYSSSPSDESSINNTTLSPAQRMDACLVSCVSHGICDGATQQCICETFWTTNPFLSTGRLYRPNCNWNVFVVIGVLIGILFGVIILSILLHCCCKRCCSREPKLADRRYKLVPDDGYGGKGSAGLLIKRSRMVDSDEDDDEAVFEARNPQFYGSTPSYNKPGEASKGSKKVIP
ncbi:hypothetical protein BV898_04001 [Hypsibius exemplaris]|uniref:EGF-like domain-containing protein n=1 Tax=Hypsibius exemplaris TaxID=2072580 RepID=A0A1W0X3R4_HYPEX|nr:hypothetical protein BV898_04001 [Hypsibius exemplaris]